MCSPAGCATGPGVPKPTSQCLASATFSELNEAYQHFFFHYSASSLLVVETSQFDPAGTDESIDDLIRQIETMTGGTRYYVPRTR